MNRAEMMDRVAADQEWDIVIIGGGATGVGIAVDAAARGHEVLLLEQNDFGKGTSSRSTKLIHGGVRYLQQGNIPLVMEALTERGLLRQNAPHLVYDMRFIVPNYDWWEAPFYGIGLKIYDLLARKYGFGHSRHLSKEKTLEFIPTLRTDGLRGGVQYFDGQFDDSRLLINLAQTACELGAAMVNYAPVTGLLRDSDGYVCGVETRDLETDTPMTVRARVVINATGPFTDEVRRMDQPDAPAFIAPSQGVHIVLDKASLDGETAIMVPHTRDGRVMFAIPWHNHVVVGTTDTPIESVSLEPEALEEEIEFILDTASGYLNSPPARSDILSVFTGIRPLVRAGAASSTAALSREHTIAISDSGLITICGGKWTTYRKMAEDCVDHAVTLGRLTERACTTRDLRIHGYHEQARELPRWNFYGSDAAALEALASENPQWDVSLADGLPYAAVEVIWAVRNEMARTVDDVLARRTRALFLNSRAAMLAAPQVAALMAEELGHDQEWQEQQLADFAAIAQKFVVPGLAE